MGVDRSRSGCNSVADSHRNRNLENLSQEAEEGELASATELHYLAQRSRCNCRHPLIVVVVAAARVQLKRPNHNHHGPGDHVAMEQHSHHLEEAYPMGSWEHHNRLDRTLLACFRDSIELRHSTDCLTALA